jgi:hypothetical protein
MPHKDPAARRAYARQRDKAIREGRHVPHAGGNPRKADNLRCDQCGTEFYRSPANRLGRGTANYCSRECMATAYVGRMVGERSPRWKGTETRPCDHCKAPVTRPLWAWDGRALTFCNRACFGQWKSNNWNGAANPVWQGGHPNYYGPNWLRQSREARRRDGHACQFCGVQESLLRRALDVHHLRPFRLYGLDRCKEANRLANLISLCEQCHTYLERFCIDGTISDWATLRQLGQAARRTASGAETQTPPCVSS